MKTFKDAQGWLDATGSAGLAVIGLGLVVGAALTGWTVVPLTVIGVGSALVLIWAATHRQALAGVLGLRSTQTNVNILVSALAVIAILGLVNFVAVRYEQQFDLTSEGLFTLSPQTTQLVKGLKQPVKIWVVATAPDPNLRPSLERYQRLNPQQIQIQYINPRNAPEQSRRLGITQDNTLAIEIEGRKPILIPAQSIDLEASLTPALSRAVGTVLSVFFAEGHGEPALAPPQGTAGLAQAAQGLTQDGYEAKPINLATAEIPPDTAALVVAGPQRNLFGGEVEKLKSYLMEGGRVMLLLNPQVGSGTGVASDYGLGPLLDDWGIKLGNDVVVDVSEVSQLLGTGPSVALVTSYGSHPITADLASQRLMTIFPLARSLAVTTKPDIEATQLLLTSPNSWGETDIASQVRFDAGKDQQGPLAIGYALTRSGAGAEAKQARLVVIGNANFALDGTFGQQGNRDLFLNALNWLADQPDRISVRPKSVTNRRFTLTRQNLNGLTLLAFILLPLAALGGGFAIWWRRR